MSDVVGSAKQLGEAIASWWPVFTSGAAAALWRYVVRPLWRRLRDGWARIEAALAQVDKMAIAFGDNGGSTLADMIRGTHHRSRLTAARVSYLQNFIERPLFEANKEGIFTSVNRAFEVMSGFSKAELVGHGWINLVLPGERARVIDEWEHAIEDRRSCVIDMPVKTRHQRVIQIQFTAFPVVDDGTNELFSWLGEMMLIATEAPK